MLKTLWAAALLALAALSAHAQDALPADPPERPRPVLILEVEAATGTGEIHIELYPELAPRHVARLMTLNAREAYVDVAFHRVIPGFMAQTGDVEFGRLSQFDRKQTNKYDNPRKRCPELPHLDR